MTDGTEFGHSVSREAAENARALMVAAAGRDMEGFKALWLTFSDDEAAQTALALCIANLDLRRQLGEPGE